MYRVKAGLWTNSLLTTGIEKIYGLKRNTMDTAARQDQAVQATIALAEDKLRVYDD